jgi:hypothetical protein
MLGYPEALSSMTSPPYCLALLIVSVEMPCCSQEKTKSAIPGNTLVKSPINGAKPKPRILNQNSVPNSPGLVTAVKEALTIR